MSELNKKLFLHAVATAQNADPAAPELTAQKRQIEAYEAGGFDPVDYPAWQQNFNGHLALLNQAAQRQAFSELATAAKAKTA